MAKTKKNSTSTRPGVELESMVAELSEQVKKASGIGAMISEYLARNYEMLSKQEEASITEDDRSNFQDFDGMRRYWFNPDLELNNLKFWIDAANMYVYKIVVRDAIYKIAFANDYTSYEGKLRVASLIRDCLNHHRSMLSIPRVEGSTSLIDCTIYALPSKDGAGRFVFESRDEKKRLRTTKDFLAVIEPIDITLSVGHVEPLSARAKIARKSKGKPEKD